MSGFPDTRASLLVRLQNAQDEAAWTAFLEIYQPLVTRLARRWGLQPADADDITQQVLMSVAGAIGRWNPDRSRGSFRGWLFRIARNLTVNLFIQQGRHPRGMGGSDVAQWFEMQPADNASETVEFDREFRRQIFCWAADKIQSEFRPQTWQAFWQTCVEGLPIPHVARQLEMSVGSVYVSRSRILARLRQTIETHSRSIEP